MKKLLGIVTVILMSSAAMASNDCQVYNINNRVGAERYLTVALKGKIFTFERVSKMGTRQLGTTINQQNFDFVRQETVLFEDGSVYVFRFLAGGILSSATRIISEETAGSSEEETDLDLQLSQSACGEEPV